MCTYKIHICKLCNHSCFPVILHSPNITCDILCFSGNWMICWVFFERESPEYITLRSLMVWCNKKTPTHWLGKCLVRSIPNDNRLSTVKSSSRPAEKIECKPTGQSASHTTQETHIYFGPNSPTCQIWPGTWKSNGQSTTIREQSKY